MIGFDNQLAQTLIDELRLRKIWNPTVTCQTILISEWDTLYGKTFPRIFSTNAKEKYDGYFSKNLHCYYYMRGLDGRTSESQNMLATQQQTETVTETENRKKWIKELKRPLGPSQIDYVQRFVHNLKSEHQTPDVIGVVGSDVYDKILLLQALRQEYRQALYFTIDLDTRLTQSQCFDTTRNMIVASHYGLSPPQDPNSRMNDMGLIRFRDSYQTAVFNACLLAIENSLIVYEGKDHDTKYDLKGEILSEILSQQRIFEIGRNCAVDLPVPLKKRSLYRLPTKTIPHRKILIVTGIILLGIMIDVFLLYYLTQSDQDKEIKKWKRSYYFIANICILIFLGLLLMSYSTETEPISWSNATSAWPGLGFRLLGNLLALWCLLKSREKLKTSKEEIEKNLFVASTLNDLINQENETTIFKRIRLLFDDSKKADEISENKKEGTTEKNRTSITFLWNHYQIRGLFSMRMLRSSIFLLFIGCVFILIEFIKPDTLFLYRGPLVQSIRFILKWCSIASSFLIIIFAGDAVWLCRHFIKKIIHQKAQFHTSKLTLNDINDDNSEELETLKVNHKKLKVISQFWKIQIIARETEAVRSLLYYPFVICFIMLISLHCYFDNPDFPLWVAAIVVIYLGFALGCGYLLQSTSEKARTKILELLDQELALHEIQQTQNTSLITAIKTVTTQIQNIKQGAFSPMFKDASFCTLLLPTSGYSLFRIAEYFLIN